MFVISEEWKTRFPEAAVGFLLVRGVSNPEQSEPLDQRGRELEDNLRERFGKQPLSVLENLRTIAAYRRYYSPYKKTYHVLLQLQSVIYQGKPLPSASSLVKAMFIAELQNQLLTAGHDLDALALPVTVGVSLGSEHYSLLRGSDQQLKPGDMIMSDAQGVISSILYGPDLRTRITPETKNVCYAVYAPAGIGEGLVYEHLRSIQENVLLVAPSAAVERLVVFTF